MASDPVEDRLAREAQAAGLVAAGDAPAAARLPRLAIGKEPSGPEFGRRLRDAMQAAGYESTPAVLEREFNRRYWGRPVTLHGVRRWLLGETLPAQDKLLVLTDWLDIEPQALRFGAGVVTAVRERRQRWDESVGYEEREILHAFLRLPVPQRNTVREVILALARAHPVPPEGTE